MNRVAASQVWCKLATPSIRIAPATINKIAAHARPVLAEMNGVAKFIAANPRFSSTRTIISHDGLMLKSWRKKSGMYFKLIDEAICVPPHIISVQTGTSHCFLIPHFTSCVQSGNEATSLAASCLVAGCAFRSNRTAGSTNRYPTKPAHTTFCSSGTDQLVSECRFTKSSASNGPTAVPSHDSISLRLRKSVRCSGRVLSTRKTCNTCSKGPFTSGRSYHPSITEPINSMI